jgi:O-antigen/teichoic acid export membrane protein
MASVFFNQVFGFFFWMLAAHLYSAEEVGIATAIISAGMMLAAFARLGFDIALVRYLASAEDKTAMINSCYTVAGLFSVILAGGFLAGISFWSPALEVLREDMIHVLMFIFFTTATTLFLLQIRVFLSFRRTVFAFFQSAVTGMRLILAPLFVVFGAIGIFGCWVIAWCTAFIIGNLFLQRIHPGYKPIPMIKYKAISYTFRFSAGNYVGEGLKMLPQWILPIIIINILEPEMAAYFYVAWSIALALFIIPDTITYSLLSETTHTSTNIRTQIIRATEFIAALLVPGILIVLFAGDILLSLFGDDYSENALHLLWYLAFSSIPFAVISLYVTICRIQGKVRPVIYAYAFIAAITIGAGYALMNSVGIEGVGIAWLIANTLVALSGITAILKQVSVHPGHGFASSNGRVD